MFKPWKNQRIKRQACKLKWFTFKKTRKTFLKRKHVRIEHIRIKQYKIYLFYLLFIIKNLLGKYIKNVNTNYKKNLD